MQVAKRSFHVVYDGDHITIDEGELLADDHALVRAYPDEFDTEERTRQHAALRRAATDPGAVEAGAGFHPSRPDADGQAREVGLRAIHRYCDVLTPDAGDRLESLVRGDASGLECRYLEAVGDPAYNSAFAKMLGDPNHGHLRFTAQETAAVQNVSAVEAQRGMLEGTGSAGGFAIPFTLDPSILLTSDGALNPIRQVAKVITIATREWKGISSAGVTASYDAEAAEVSDDTPTVGQPTITTAMGRAFIPFSIEIGQDWASLAAELTTLISDARDVLDATKLLTGSGVDEPAGVLTGLSTTQRVLTAGTAGFAIADLYALKQAVPARYSARASWAANPSTWDSVFRFVGGNSAEPAPLPAREGGLLGQSKGEWSTMATGTTTGAKIIVGGDWQTGFTIADRIGMTVEIVPHLFGASRRPTGERGVFAYWRTGSKVVVPQALRYLEIR